MVIVYKESSINWHTLGRLITTEHFGLVNLIAGEEVATELMQDDLNGERLANELLLLLDKKRNQEARQRLREVREQLGGGGASRRAAERILEFLDSSNNERTLREAVSIAMYRERTAVDFMNKTASSASLSGARSKFRGTYFLFKLIQSPSQSLISSRSSGRRARWDASLIFIERHDRNTPPNARAHNLAGKIPCLLVLLPRPSARECDHRNLPGRQSRNRPQ